MPWSTTTEADCVPAPTWRQLASLRWWINDQERNRAWPWWAWFWRNGLGNVKACVIGVADRPRQWVSTMEGQNWPAWGWGFGWCIADGCWLPRPWICRRGRCLDFKRVLGVLIVPVIRDMEIGAGWKSHGGFGINWRHAFSPNAGPLP